MKSILVARKSFWRDYGHGEIVVLMLGSDVEEYPHYLHSAAQMLQSVAMPIPLPISMDDIDEYLESDDRIDAHAPFGK